MHPAMDRIIISAVADCTNDALGLSSLMSWGSGAEPDPDSPVTDDAEECDTAWGLRNSSPVSMGPGTECHPLGLHSPGQVLPEE
jgi:hypothetical protein